MEGIAGKLVFKGKLIENPDDVSFRESFVLNKDRFTVVCGEGAGGQALVWKRFPEVYITDYFYMSAHYFDAVTFIAKRNIAFRGFGIFKNYFGVKMELIVKWIINDEASEEYELELLHEERDEENHWHTFDIASVGMKPIKCNEGDRIDCCLKVKVSNDMKKCIYGYQGYKDKYSKIEG